VKRYVVPHVLAWLSCVGGWDGVRVSTNVRGKNARNFYDFATLPNHQQVRGLSAGQQQEQTTATVQHITQLYDTT
jgi:hypothetical protein